MFSFVRSVLRPLDLQHHVIIAGQENALDLTRSSLAIKFKFFPKAFYESAEGRDSRLVKSDQYLNYAHRGKPNYMPFEKCLGHKVLRIGPSRKSSS